MSERLAPSSRHCFTHQGRKIYEWDQTLAEVNMYVGVPSGVRGKDMFCDIEQRHIKFGLKGNPPFMDLDLAGAVKVSESMWTLEDGELHISMCKLEQGDPWPSAIKGHEVDVVTRQQEQQRLMLERFQQEHPGFDFSQAKFNGEAPNPRTFLGGMGSAHNS